MQSTIALLSLILVIPLHASPGAGAQWNGTATFQSGISPSAITVTLKFPTMVSIPEASYPAKIVPGICTEPSSGIDYALNPVQNSTSATSVHVTIATLTAKPHHVVVTDAKGTIRTCGNILEPRAAS
jgi:hypothetical protein